MSNDDLMKSVTFDQAADYYDATRGLPAGVEPDIAQTLVRAGNLTTKSQVLEIGVGTGRIAQPLTPHVKTLTGIDLSKRMLDQFQTKLSESAEKNVALIQGDITRLPFPDDTFDAIVAVHIFHLVPTYQHALSEAARVLKPAGRLLHGTTGLGFGDLWNSWRVVLQDYPPQLARLNWDKIDSTLQEAGWSPDDEPEVYQYVYQRAPSVIRDWLQARRFSITWELPEELLQQGVQALTEALDAEFDDPTKPVNMEAEFKVFKYQPPQ